MGEQQVEKHRVIHLTALLRAWGLRSYRKVGVAVAEMIQAGLLHYGKDYINSRGYIMTRSGVRKLILYIRDVRPRAITFTRYSVEQYLAVMDGSEYAVDLDKSLSKYLPLSVVAEARGWTRQWVYVKFMRGDYPGAVVIPTPRVSSIGLVLIPAGYAR